MVRDDKYYACFRTDLQKMLTMNYSPKESADTHYRPEPKPDFNFSKAPDYQPMTSVNLHENRDKLKNKFH